MILSHPEWASGGAGELACSRVSPLHFWTALVVQKAPSNPELLRICYSLPAKESVPVPTWGLLKLLKDSCLVSLQDFFPQRVLSPGRDSQVSYSLAAPFWTHSSCSVPWVVTSCLTIALPFAGALCWADHVFFALLSVFTTSNLGYLKILNVGLDVFLVSSWSRALRGYSVCFLRS